MKSILPYLILIVIVLTMTSSLRAQCPTGNVSLSSQAQIDAFPTGCATIPGNLTISESSPGDITSLSPLSELTLVDGRLLVFDNADLSTLTGLDNITTSTQSTRVSKNNSLTDLTGLGGLVSVNSFLQIDNNENLTSVNGLNVGLQVDGRLLIENNDELLNLSGMAGITQIGDATLKISGNPKLTDISGINNINPASILNLIIEDNTQLSVCAVTVVCNYLATPVSMATISGNATGCANRTEAEDACRALPVSYASFLATAQGKANVLSWVTAAEAGNRGFDVQRSHDGITWESLGFVPAQRPGDLYIFRHEQPALGWHYYRLDQEDVDGSRERSPIRSLYVNATSEVAKVYPNPASDQITVVGKSGDDVFDLRVFDLHGRLLSSATAARQLSVSGFAPGTYVLEAEGEKSVSRHRIVVRR